jgi:hypothetical protein
MVIRRWFKPIDENSAAKIVRETRVRGRSKVDLKKLSDDLNLVLEAVEDYWRVDLARSRRSRKKLEIVDATVRKLRTALINSDDAPGLQGYLLSCAHEATSEQFYRDLGFGPLEDPDEEPAWDPRKPLVVSRVLVAIDLLSRWTARALKWDWPLPRSTYSPVILASMHLPAFYEEHFGQPFGAGSGSKDVSDGPGIRFIRATLTAADITAPNGKPYSAETIRTYCQIGRNLTPRRRARP